VQVVDELRQVLNGVDVVVGGRGNERHSRLGASQVRNVRRDFATRELATLSCVCVCVFFEHLHLHKHLATRPGSLPFTSCHDHQAKMRGSVHVYMRTWLGALRDFDLQLVCVHCKLGGHTKAPTCHL